MASLNFNDLWNSEYFDRLLKISEIELIKITNCGVYKMIVNEGNITKSYLLKIYQTVPEDSLIFTNKINVDKEVENQINIYNITASDPLCPKINYYDELSLDNINILKKKIIDNFDKNINNNNNINDDNIYVKSLIYIQELYSFLGLNFDQGGGGGNSNDEFLRHSQNSQGTAEYIPSNNNNNNKGTAPYIPSNNEENRHNKNNKRKAYVLCMDFLEGYVPMTNLPVPVTNLPDPDLYINEFTIQTIQIIIELLIKTKYVHGDFHKENIMFTMNDTTNFYKGIEVYFGMNIRPMLIDFEHSYQLDDRTYEQIKNLYDNKNYTDIIKFICNDKKSLRINTERYIYDYLCKYILNKQTINKKVKQYFDMRERYILDFKFYNNQKRNNEKINNEKEAENRGFVKKSRGNNKGRSRSSNRKGKEKSRSSNRKERSRSRNKNN